MLTEVTKYLPILHTDAQTNVLNIKCRLNKEFAKSYRLNILKLTL